MRTLLLSFTAAAFMATALAVIRDAGAQVLSPTSTSTSSSASGSTSTSGSTSSSVSGGGAGGAATSNAAAQGGAATTTGSNGLTFNSGNNSPSTVNNPGDVTIRSAPQVYVPSVITGNVCALGASAGASFIGTGFAVGASWESEQCERRQTAALLHNAGYKDAAREIMCDKREVYDAMKRGGTPCLSRQAWEARTATQQQAPVPLLPVPIQPVPRFNAAAYPTGAECLNAAQQAGASYSECAGKR